MWPFNLIQLLRNQILELQINNNHFVERINDLERSVEVMTGANQILSQQLELAQRKEAELLNKIFEVTGLIKSQTVPSNREAGQPIQVGKIGLPWPQVKQNLEMKARAEYWEKKKQDQEVQANIEQLEKDILEG